MTTLEPVSVPLRFSLLGHFNEFGRDPLGLLERCAKCGDLAEMRFLHRRVFLLSKPEMFESILVKNASKFGKNITFRTPLMRRMFGNGVFTSEGALWSLHRKQLGEWMRSDKIDTYLTLASEELDRTLEEWKSHQNRDLQLDLHGMTLRSFSRLLIDDIDHAGQKAFASATTATQEIFYQQCSWRGLLQNFLPLKQTRNHRRSVAELDRQLIHLIQRRKQKPGHGHDDFLQHLLACRGTDGHPLAERLIRDELSTILFAGTETTSLVLSWALYLLASHPKILERARDEIKDVAGSGPPTPNVLPRLKLLSNIVRETMRLYPPVWIVAREAREPIQIEGIRLKKGETILMSQWTTHRDPRYFENPDEFDPDRWEDPSIKALPRFAYFPFSGGPRVCPGRSFAEMAAIQALARIIQTFYIDIPENPRVEPLASLTLLPKGGITATVTPLQEPH